MLKFLLSIALLLSAAVSYAQEASFHSIISQKAEEIESKVIAWRHDFHQHPELSNREFKTAQKIEKHLRELGLEVQTGVAHTGVVAILKGGKPGPVVALRADIDALPVKERVELPYASKATGEYNGAEVPVMHACGHDTHIAILMGVAEILSGMKDQVPGTIKFIFQPAEEGSPKGEEGGAELMVKEGVLKNPEVKAVFGLHINSQTDIGTIKYRHGGLMASVDDFKITVKGKQTHGSTPWSGIDPIVVSAQIINSLQTIVSRSMPLTENAAVVTIGSIHGGVRSNIIPEEVEMVGTIRALDEQMRKDIHARIKTIATNVAESMEATVEIELPYSASYPVTYNNPELVDQMLPTLEGIAGKGKVVVMNPITGAEDFSFYAREVPGFFFFLGGKPLDVKPEDAAPHHTPDFYVDDSGMLLGVKALAGLALDYMQKSAVSQD